jgi:hypothetical protein
MRTCQKSSLPDADSRRFNVWRKEELMRNRKPILIVVAALLITANSCSFTKGKGIAEAAVKQFHNQFNDEKFHEIYSQADEEFKNSASEADFIALLEAVHRKLGTVKNSNPAGWRINSTTMGTITTLAYEVDFSEGKGTEEFVFRISGDKATLYHYNVNSPLLITR